MKGKNPRINSRIHILILNLVLSHIIQTTGTISEIESQISITVVFLGSSLPTPTNGGFKSQEEFRKHVLEHQNGKWETELIARPTSDRERDYNDDTIGDAFPLQFPFGHTGLRTDPAIIELKEKSILKRK
jgi:hypothetical protein